MKVDEAVVGRIFREEFGRSVAALCRAFGDIDVAEDAVQEAFAVALTRWQRDGLPQNPGGWITTTARNRGIDRLRRELRGRELLGEMALLSAAADDRGVPEEDGPVDDDRLRLIFTCCHPALSQEAQVALTLRLLGGLSTKEVASSFLVAEATMGKRLVRAKRKIKAARIPYRAPADHELPTRLPPVLAVIYLVYNAGLARTAEPSLCDEAIRLARLLVTLMPDEPEVAGLLALLLLAESRRASRIRPDGSLALLAEQDRGGWDRALIDEGRAIVRQCLRRGRLGRYQLQAAISAEHADAATIAETDWPAIVALYDQLLAIARTPVVALNRAIAIGEVEGPAAALALVDHLRLEGYYPFHATRGDLLQRLGREREAAAAFARAAALAPTDAEREFLERGGRAARRSSSSRPASARTGPIQPTEEPRMTAHEIVGRYYDAWQTKRGDLSEVPLADDFRFTGPVASFDSAEGYRAMALQAGQAVTSFEVREQFIDGDTVCSIIDWEMAIPGVGPMTAAELLEVRDGAIVRGELIYDAEGLRRAMAETAPDADARADA